MLRLYILLICIENFFRLIQIQVFQKKKMDEWMKNFLKLFIHSSIIVSLLCVPSSTMYIKENYNITISRHTSITGQKGERPCLISFNWSPDRPDKYGTRPTYYGLPRYKRRDRGCSTITNLGWFVKWWCMGGTISSENLHIKHHQ